MALSIHSGMSLKIVCFHLLILIRNSFHMTLESERNPFSAFFGAVSGVPRLLTALTLAVSIPPFPQTRTLFSLLRRALIICPVCVVSACLAVVRECDRDELISR